MTRGRGRVCDELAKLAELVELVTPSTRQSICRDAQVATVVKRHVARHQTLGGSIGSDAKRVGLQHLLQMRLGGLPSVVKHGVAV